VHTTVENDNAIANLLDERAAQVGDMLVKFAAGLYD